MMIDYTSLAIVVVVGTLIAALTLAVFLKPSNEDMNEGCKKLWSGYTTKYYNHHCLIDLDGNGKFVPDTNIHIQAR